MKENEVFQADLDSSENGWIERQKNLAHIHKPEGTYTIIYNSEFQILKPEPIPFIGPQEIPESPVVDTRLIPESVEELMIQGPEDTTKNSLSYIYSLRCDRSHADLFGIMQERGTKLLMENSGLWATTMTEFDIGVTTLGEAAAGAYLLDYLRRTPMTRRTFLKLAGYSLGAWLIAPLQSAIARKWPAELSYGGGLTAELRKAVEKVHPEDGFVSIHLKNTLLAYKQQWLMAQKDQPSHNACIVDSLNVGIEDKILKSKEENLEFIRKTAEIWKPVLDPHTFARIEAFEFDKTYRYWQEEGVIEIPELKELVLR
jgi:hypothetical protein